MMRAGFQSPAPMLSLEPDPNLPGTTTDHYKFSPLLKTHEYFCLFLVINFNFMFVFLSFALAKPVTMNHSTGTL